MPKLTDSKKRENKELILNASFSCFNRKGFHKTSMRDIANEANLSLGAIYVYFETKVEILKALVWKSIDQRRKFLEEKGERGLRSFLMDLAREMEKPEGMMGFRVDMGVWVALLDDDEVKKLAENAVEGFIEDFAAWLAKQNVNEIPESDFDTIEVARVILAIIQGGAVQKIIYPELNLNRYFETAIKLITY